MNVFFPTAAVLLLLTASSAAAQVPLPLPDSAAAPLTFYGFVDGYYGYDFTGKQAQRPAFLYAHNRANEFTVNNAVLGLRYQDERVRGALGLHAGSYVVANYAGEPAVLRPLYEAYAGFRPWAKAWLDLGVFTSHIGFESALSQDNWTLTRSLMAENSPYYEAGARLAYEVSGRLTLTALVLNGWQNIRDNNRAKAVGTQIQWQPTEKLLLNSSTFYGNEQPQGLVSRRRYFHDFYVSYAAAHRLRLALVFDVGKQQQADHRTRLDTWHAGAALARYQLASQWWAAGRAEYYHAQHGVFIRSISPAATDPLFYVQGASVNLDYAPTARVLCRVEGRLLRSRAPLFPDDAGQLTRSYANVTSSIALSF